MTFPEAKRIARTCAWYCVALWSAFLPACHRASHSGGEALTLALPPFTVDIAANRVSGIPGTQFDLAASTQSNERPIVSFAWDFDDGRTATGSTTSIDYATPGDYVIQCTATDDRGRTFEHGLLLKVFDPAQAGSTGGLGDLDLDGSVTLLDAQLLGQHVAGLATIIDPTLLQGADLDVDGDIDDDDVALLCNAVASGADFPQALLPAGGGPGTLVSIFSSALLDPFADVKVAIGADPAINVIRPRLGLATIQVPLFIDGTDPAAITARELPVVLFADGVEVARFDFALSTGLADGGQLSADIEEFLQIAFAELDDARAQADAFCQSAGATPEQRASFLALIDRARDHLTEAALIARAGLQHYGPEGRRQLSVVANANGLAEMMEEARTQFSAHQLDLSAAEWLDYACRLNRVVDLMEKFDYLVVASCAAGIGGFLLVPGANLIAAALLGWCANAGAASDLINVALDVLPKVDETLVVTADKTSLADGETAAITATVHVRGCMSGTLSDLIIEKAIERIVRRATLGLSFDIIRHFPLVDRGLIREELKEAVKNAVQRILGQALDWLGVSDAIEELGNLVCDHVGASTDVPFDMTLASVTVEPSDAGPLTLINDQTVGFAFDGNSTADSAVVRILADECDFTLKGEVTILSNGGDVTFTMGDNGNLNDDIYEVVVDGTSILTSSVPVRSISTTISLGRGIHNVDMIGRAAPDGIGTYFIIMEGVDILSGPPTTGTDLTAGTVFTWLVDKP